MTTRRGQSWDVRDIGDTAGLPLFGALLSIYFLATTPFTNGITPTHEAEADNYGIVD